MLQGVGFANAQPPCLTSRRPWLGIPAVCVRCAHGLPRVAPGGFFALMPSAVGGCKGSLASLGASRPCARPRFRPCALAPSGAAGGGVGWGSLPSLWPAPCGPSAAPAAVGWAALVGLRVSVGVCCGCSVACFGFRSGGFRGAAFRSLPGCALGGCCFGVFVPPFPPVAVRVCRGRAVFFFRRCVAVLPFVGSALAAASGFLCCSSGRWWLCGLAAGLPVLAAVPFWPSALAGRLVVPLLPLPVLVASVSGCRSRWLAHGCRRVLVVRCGSPALAAFVCRRARAFGLPPLRAGRSGRLVLLPAARVAPPSPLSLRFGGPPALSAPPLLPGLPLPVPPRGGRSSSPARRPGPAFSFKQGRLF